MNNFFISVVTTLLASLSTGIGGLISIIPKKNNSNFLSFCLGISAGAMICLSVIEIIPESLKYLGEYHKFNNVFLLTILGFIIGTLIVIFTNKVLNTSNNSLYKTGVITMIAVALHNFPEGIIIFMTSTQNITLGITIAIAIAIHNIPEGIAIASPIYHSTHNKVKAVSMSLFSGLFEVIGGLICMFVFKSFINNYTIGFMLSIVAGIMVYISLYNLIPESIKQGNKKYSYYGIFLGVIIMSITHIILK